MITSLYFKIPRRLRILVLFLLIVFASYFITRVFLGESKEVPREFLEARQQASVIAQEIIRMSDETANRLNEVSNLSQERKYTEAVNLIVQEIERNRQAREKAIRLSAQLEKMTQSISGITPKSASQSALEAVSSEVALISRLISYNDYMIQLLEVLRAKFLGQEKNSDGKIQELIEKINNEARAINDLDQKFNRIMSGFDSYF
ncbi:MAG: hypothetical protein AAB651_00765 [Patescibacteria group bacterium]